MDTDRRFTTRRTRRLTPRKTSPARAPLAYTLYPTSPNYVRTGQRVIPPRKLPSSARIRDLENSLERAHVELDGWRRQAITQSQARRYDYSAAPRRSDLAPSIASHAITAAVAAELADVMHDLSHDDASTMNTINDQATSLDDQEHVIDHSIDDGDLLADDALFDNDNAHTLEADAGVMLEPTDPPLAEDVIPTFDVSSYDTSPEMDTEFPAFDNDLAVDNGQHLDAGLEA